METVAYFPTRSGKMAPEQTKSCESYSMFSDRTTVD